MARVGSYEIDQASYDHLLAAEAQSEEAPNQTIPVPPRFALCVKQLSATAKGLGVQAPVSVLRTKCQERYEALKERTLDRLLVADWVRGEAAEVGLSVDSGEVQRALEDAKRERFADDAQYKRYLDQTGLSGSELVRQEEVKLLAELIQHGVTQPYASLSRARVKAYYDTHPTLDARPETRDIRVVRAGSSATAGLRVRREIRQGRRFASLARALPRQPAESRHGFKAHYETHAFRQPRLNRAILAAEPHVLTGPVKTEHGYYVFEVTHVYPPKRRPFRDLEASLLRTLPGRLARQALSTFSASWTKRWKAKTSCAPGYRVPLCTQSKRAPSRVPLEAPGAFE